MKILVYIILMFCLSLSLYAQDSLKTEFEIADELYSNLKPEYNGILLDRAVTTPRSVFDKVASASDTITANDWLILYHAFNVADETSNLADETFNFVQKLNHYRNNLQSYYNKFVVPIGIFSRNAHLIKDSSYLNGDVYYNVNTESYEINSNKAFGEVSTFRQYNSIAPLYDLDYPESDFYFLLDTNHFFTDIPVTKIILNNVEYFPNDLIPVNLTNNDSILSATVYFSDGNYFHQHIKINNTINDSLSPKSSLFTGGKHNYPVSLDLPLWADGLDVFNYKLRYGVIWGECNGSGKLRKPVFMLHGFRPTVLPVMPTLNKLYRTKFNYGGTQFGSDGLVDLLVKNGFDVVICRIDPGYLSIRQGGRLLRDFFINVVEPQKESIGSKHENIVLGFSMGGHYWRHMLMLMEHEHLNEGANYHHHTRMWIPTDTPLHGANNPLAHQFAAKSIAENPAGVPSFAIAYTNMLTPGSREQQRYDVWGVNGNDGASHRFHQWRVDYIDELENTFYLGDNLTQFKGFPSATRNVAISVGSNSVNHYTEFNNIGTTYEEESQIIGLLSTKKFNVQLNAARYRSTLSSIGAKEVFHRKITRKFHFNQNENVLVDDKFEMYEWLEMDDCFGSYLNPIRNNVNFALRVNSLFGFTDYVYKKNQVFVPVLSALAIEPRFWPNDMRSNLKDNGLLFNSFDLTENGISDHFGYPHLGRPADYKELTPMDAIYCNPDLREHITLIDTDSDQGEDDDNSELVDFLLNEIQPWYLDLQNQELGQYARPDYIYTAKYEAKDRLQLGDSITPKTPFGKYEVRGNVDVEYTSENEINILPGTFIGPTENAHFYLVDLCYTSQSIGEKSIYGNESETDNSDFDLLVSTVGNKQITIFPNPTQNTFSFNNIEFNFEKNTYLIEIYTSFGLLLNRQMIQRNTIKTQNLSVGGVYFVKLYCNGELISTNKLLKQ